MKLHLGCGDKRIEGYVNIDAREIPGVVDEVADIKTLDNYKKESVDLIYACHVLEHIPRREYTAVLTRWFEILKHGGKLRLAVPDIEQVFYHYKHHGNLRALRGYLWGGQTHGFNYHYCGWDFKDMEQDLTAIGFHDIKRYDWRATDHANINDFSKAYLPHDPEAIKDNSFGDKHQLMSLNIIATK